MLHILIFAGLAEAVGASSVKLEIELPATVAEAKRAFAAAYPAAADRLADCFAAINQEYADDAAVIRSGDEAAFLPPVSGG